MSKKLFVALALIAQVTFPVYAAYTACPAHYLNGDAPEITNARMAAKAREVCFSSFNVMHSGITRTPLWSAERLTRASMEDAKDLARVNSFHAEASLPPNERAELKDYSRSGFDRGHLAPSGDMPNSEAMQESFSLANMIPQNPNNNRQLWQEIESTVRVLARKEGELFVITGPLFEGERLQQLNGRVMAPTHIYKVVYAPKRGKAAAYLVENIATDDYSIISVAELEEMAGVNFFPNMPQAVKQAKLDLPEPTSRGRYSGEKSRSSISISIYSEVDSMLRKLRALLP
jgi:endonuclease G, mitochondrial